jgi:nitroreductase/NAD-dependent dihydropyrimidine dehydrogenase PreA subunit
MITIDKDKCTGCGLCEKICHESCIAVVDNSPNITYEVCSTCTQCIAVCPRKALTWDNKPPITYNKMNLPTPEQLDELFRERRSTRSFKKDKIERGLLEEIAGYGIYAPTENFHLRAIIMDDDAIIAELEQELMKITLRINRFVFQPKFIFVLSKMTGLSHTYLRSKAKVEETIKRGHAFSSPPGAMVFIIGEKRIPLSDASVQYALANMIYYAQAKGIGSCLSGNGPLFFDKNKKIRNRLKLQKRENILGTLFLGYPAIKFSNKIIGKAMPIQWIDS